MGNILFEDHKYRIAYDAHTKTFEIEIFVDMDIDSQKHVVTVEDVANALMMAGETQENVLKYIKEELGIIPTTNKKMLQKVEDAANDFKKENKKMLTRKEMLQKVEQIVCQDRERQYGSPEDNFAKIAKLWNAYLGKNDISPADVAVMMSLLKIARISSGEYKEDSWVDLAGYAICGGAIASMEDD